jgi:hypothetical protein
MGLRGLNGAPPPDPPPTPDPRAGPCPLTRPRASVFTTMSLVCVCATHHSRDADVVPCAPHAMRPLRSSNSPLRQKWSDGHSGVNLIGPLLMALSKPFPMRSTDMGTRTG